jgi:hypothetical protein
MSPRRRSLHSSRETIGVISRIELLPLVGSAIRVHTGSQAACAGLRALDDAVPAGQGLSGLTRE